MRQLRHPIRPVFDKSAPVSEGFTRPRFEWHDGVQSVRIDVFVPGVEDGDVEISVDGIDLLIIAHRRAPLVANWQAANIGAVRLDYRLRLPLPYDVDPQRIAANLDDGVLAIEIARIPERGNRHRIVA